jgi:hypothetical protein
MIALLSAYRVKTNLRKEVYLEGLANLRRLALISIALAVVAGTNCGLRLDRTLDAYESVAVGGPLLGRSLGL